MNNFKKRFIAIAALLCVALTSVTGCSGKNESSEGGNSGGKSGNSASEEAPVVVAPFTWAANDTEDENPLDTPDPEAPTGDSAEDPTKASGEETTEYKAVVDENGEPVTEVVTATDAQGQPVTDAKGEPVTEVVPVTTVVQAATQAATRETTKAYTAATTGMYAMWIDISKDENFFFNDSFIRVTFKVKDNIPDGNYSINLTSDLSSIAGVSIKPDYLINGSVTVGKNATAVQGNIPSDGLVIYGDNITAKQGDTVDFCINMKNNPGLAALVVWFYYDKNAFEIVDCTPDGEFAEIAARTAQIGSKDN